MFGRICQWNLGIALFHCLYIKKNIIERITGTREGLCFIPWFCYGETRNLSNLIFHVCDLEIKLSILSIFKDYFWKLSEMIDVKAFRNQKVPFYYTLFCLGFLGSTMENAICRQLKFSLSIWKARLTPSSMSLGQIRQPQCPLYWIENLWQCTTWLLFVPTRLSFKTYPAKSGSQRHAKFPTHQ